MGLLGGLNIDKYSIAVGECLYFFNQQDILVKNHWKQKVSNTQSSSGERIDFNKLIKKG